MTSTLAFIFGATAICALVQGGAYTVLSKRVRREWALASAIVVFVAIATVLGGFGMADDGPLQFLRAFFIYASASLFVTVLTLFGMGRSGN